MGRQAPSQPFASQANRKAANRRNWGRRFCNNCIRDYLNPTRCFLLDKLLLRRRLSMATTELGPTGLSPRLLGYPEAGAFRLCRFWLAWVLSLRSRGPRRGGGQTIASSS